MIITKLISGLGNQLFQYAIGRLQSIKHNVPLKLDLSFYEDQNLRKYSLHNFNIKAEIATHEEIDKLTKKYKTNSLSRYLYHKFEDYIPLKHISHYREKKWYVYDEKIFHITSPCYIDGYWQNYRYFENLPPQILEDLTIKGVKNDYAKSLLHEILQNPLSVSLHIRRGDYISDINTKNYMGVMPISYYIDAISIIKSSISNPTFYIFSDDIKWAKQNIIVEASLIFVEENEDYEDLELMSACKHQIIANSSFSWWAAYLNSDKNKIVVSPKNWVVSDNINKYIEIQLPAWQKI